MRRFALLAALATMLLAGCSTAPKKENTLFQTYAPRSILVLPPMNNSVEVNASYTFLSTISRPLAEKGYYVFPVSVIDTFLKENGLPTPAEMNAIPLDKIRQHIGADAVLYVTINNWGQKFQIISSTTVVNADLRMVDTVTGTEIWQAKVRGSSDSSGSSNNNSLAAAILSAVVDQIASSLSDATYELSRSANQRAIEYNLPKGPYRIAAEQPLP